MFLLLFILQPMFFRWGCKNWPVTKLLHPVPRGVSSPGLQHGQSVPCEHQWLRLAAAPAEQQTRLWETGSSALCPALLPTHRRLGNAGGKKTSCKFFSSDWCLIQSRSRPWMASAKRGPDSPGSAKRLISWAALNPIISPENICVSLSLLYAKC